MHAPRHRPTSTATSSPAGSPSNVFNRIVAVLTRARRQRPAAPASCGSGAARRGEWRDDPGQPAAPSTARRYLVAPRGTHPVGAQPRAAGTGELRVGRRVEAFRAVEVADADKVDVLRDYLRRWKMEVGVFFDGVGPDADRRGARRHRPRLPGVRDRFR